MSQPSFGISWGLEDDILRCDEFDDILNSFHEPDVKPVTESETSPQPLHILDMFVWEDVKLSETDQHLYQLGQASPTESLVTDQPIESPISDVPCEIPLPVLSSSEDNFDVDNVDNKSCSGTGVLSREYGLSDEQLSDLSLKSLRSLCKSDNDFDELKAYRRTCQNRYYARSSRSKQQVKTSRLSKKLDQTEQKVVRLEQENEMKDATIRCLQLELQILRSLKQE